jgi:hypothetical protein
MICLIAGLSIAQSQSKTNIENLYSAQKLIKESEFNIEENIRLGNNNFITYLNRYFDKRDSVAKKVYTIDFVYDKSYYSSLFDDAMEGEDPTHINKNKRTQYKKPTGVFYLYETNKDEIIVRFGIATNREIDEIKMIGFPIGKGSKSSLSQINLSKAKLKVSYQISKAGDLILVDTIHLVSDKISFSVFLGRNIQEVPFPKRDLLRQIVDNFKLYIKKSQFETTEEFIRKKMNTLGILDSILSMTFYEPLVLSNIAYDADSKMLSLEIYDHHNIKCTAKVNVESAKLVIEQSTVYGVAKCLLNTTGELEIMEPVFIKLGNIIINADPMYFAISRRVKSIHVSSSRFDILDISDDSLIVLSDRNGESQTLMIYNANSGTLVNRYKKPTTDVLISHYLNPAKLFLDIYKGDDIGELNFIFWSLSDSSIPKKAYTTDLGYGKMVGGSYMDPMKNFKVNYLNHDSLVCLAIYRQQKHLLFNTVDASLTSYVDEKSQNPIYDNGAPPEFMPTGLFVFTSPEKGFIKINARNSIDKLNYSYLRSVAADYYQPLEENVLIDRNKEWVLHILSSGEEKTLKSFYRSMSSTNMWNMGDYVVVEDDSKFTVYNPSSDSLVGSFISKESPKLFKYGYLVKDLVPETIQIVSFTTR